MTLTDRNRAIWGTRPGTRLSLIGFWSRGVGPIVYRVVEQGNAGILLEREGHPLDRCAIPYEQVSQLFAGVKGVKVGAKGATVVQPHQLIER